MEENEEQTGEDINEKLLYEEEPVILTKDNINKWREEQAKKLITNVERLLNLKNMYVPDSNKNPVLLVDFLEDLKDKYYLGQSVNDDLTAQLIDIIDIIYENITEIAQKRLKDGIRYLIEIVTINAMNSQNNQEEISKMKEEITKLDKSLAEQEKNLVNLEAYKNYAFVIEEDVKNLFNRFIEDIKKNSERRKQDFNIPDLLEEKKVKLID